MRQPSIARRALLAVSRQGDAPASLPPVRIRHVLLFEELHQEFAGRETLLVLAEAMIVAQNLATIPTGDEILAWASSQPDGSLANIGGRLAEAWRTALEPTADLAPPRVGDSMDDVELLGSGEDTGNGIGWVLTLVENLAAEYGWRVGEILELPVNTALALCTASRLRQGYTWQGPTYAEQEELEKEEADSDVAPPPAPISSLLAQPAFVDNDTVGIPINGQQTDHHQNQSQCQKHD